MTVEQKQKVVKIFNRLFNEANTTEMSVKRIEEISEAIDLVKNLHIPGVGVPKGTYCELYKSECMKGFCSVTPHWKKCNYLK